MIAAPLHLTPGGIMKKLAALAIAALFVVTPSAAHAKIERPIHIYVGSCFYQPVKTVKVVNGHKVTTVRLVAKCRPATPPSNAGQRAIDWD